MHFAKKRQPGFQLDHKAGVDRLGHSVRTQSTFKPTNLVGVMCGTRIRKDRGYTCRTIHLAYMEHTHNNEEDYNSWHSRQDLC